MPYTRSLLFSRKPERVSFYRLDKLLTVSGGIALESSDDDGEEDGNEAEQAPESSWTPADISKILHSNYTMYHPPSWCISKCLQ